MTKNLKDIVERLTAPPFLDGQIGDLMFRAGEAYLEDYVMGGDESADHEPTEFERFMLEDFVNGLMGDEALFGPVRALLLEAANALSEVEDKLRWVLLNYDAATNSLQSAERERDTAREASLILKGDPEAVEVYRTLRRERDEAREVAQHQSLLHQEAKAELDEALSRVGELERVLRQIMAIKLPDSRDRRYVSAGLALIAWCRGIAGSLLSRGGGDEGASSQKPTTSAAHGVRARAAPTAEEP